MDVSVASISPAALRQLCALTVIVRGAAAHRLALAPPAAALAAVSLGLSRIFGDDLEMPAHGMVRYDALTPGARTAAMSCTPGSRRAPDEPLR